MSRRRSNRWRAIALLATLAALAATLAGCAAPPLPWQAHQPAPLPDAQQVLHVALPGRDRAEVTLDPITYSANGSLEPLMLSLTYSTVVTFDAGLRPMPSLATSYGVSADGLRYTFYLRPEARFTEGTPLTSADVAFSLNRVVTDCGSYLSFAFAALRDAARAVDPQCAMSALPPNQSHIALLVGDALLTPDPQTLVIVLAQPDGALLAKLAMPECGIVERAVAQRYGAQWAAHLADGGGQGTSGMYRLASNSEYAGGYGLRLTLERASHYWGAMPRLREVVFDLYNRDSSVSGDVIVEGPGGYSQERVSSMAWHTAPTRAQALLTLDPTEPGLSDIRVRVALALAIDKTALAKSIGGAATNHLMPPGVAGYPTTPSGPLATAPLAGDVAQAQALLRRYVTDKCGGVASACPHIFVIDYGWTGGTDQMTPLFARWKALLPGLPIIGAEAPDLLTAIPYHIALPMVWYEDYPDPQDWLEYFALGSAEYFGPSIHDPNADALVMSAEDTRDPTARLALYHQAEEAVINDALVVPIAQLQVTWGVKPTVINFPSNPALSIAPSAWARIYLTAAASG